MDLLQDTPRQLLDELLPSSRREYIRAWEFLADATHTLERRRLARQRAQHQAVETRATIEVLGVRSTKESGEQRAELEHLAGQLERLADGLERIAGLSPLAVQAATDSRPDAVGCGRRFRDPGRGHTAPRASRAVAARPRRRSDRDR